MESSVGINYRQNPSNTKMDNFFHGIIYDIGSIIGSGST